MNNIREIARRDDVLIRTEILIDDLIKERDEARQLAHRFIVELNKRGVIFADLSPECEAWLAEVEPEPSEESNGI